MQRRTFIAVLGGAAPGLAAVALMLLSNRTHAEAGCRRYAPDVAGWHYYYASRRKCWFWIEPPQLAPLPKLPPPPVPELLVEEKKPSLQQRFEDAFKRTAP